MPSALPQAQAVQVQRLHLRGPAPAVQAARQHLAAWQAAAWPGTGDDEVLLLRRLHLQAPGTLLGAVAAAEARALASRASGPWGPGADSAVALRFGSLAEYLAWQLHQRLRVPAGAGPAGQAQAIADLLCQRPLALPLVCQHLQRAAPGQGLVRLWRALDGPSAQRVLATVAVATGWGPSLAPAGRPADGDAQPPLLQQEAVLQGDLAQQARQALAGLPPGDARVRLAAVLLLWRQAPAALAAGAAAGPLRQLAEQLTGAAAPAAPLPAAAKPDTWWRCDPPAPADDTAHLAPATPAGTAPGLQPNTRSARPTATTEATTSAPPTDTAPPMPTSAGQAGGLDANTAPGAAGQPSADSGDSRFLTTHGGLFFLVQVLGGPLFQQRLAQLPEAQAGWREWLCLAHALGAEPDAPLLAFAADAAQLDSPAQAAALHWPASIAQPLLQAAEARFGRDALQAAIAPRPARVVASATQVDVHFRLADAALAVRRVGLDADPGWLPWLGRVLRWHYGSALAPPPAAPPPAHPTPEPPP